MDKPDTKKILDTVTKYSSELKDVNELAIILAAGHGKRLKSEKSKMLHTILGVPTVERVYNACIKAIKEINVIIVAGIKAVDVMHDLGKKRKMIYVYQEVEPVTGYAVP